MKKILLIIPAYNEEKNILNTYEAIIKYNGEFHSKYDVIVINDGSRDNTEKILMDHKIPHIRLIQNLWIGGAEQTGYIYALRNDYDVAVQFDGDGQHDVSYVKTIVDPILNGTADMVIGSASGAVRTPAVFRASGSDSTSQAAYFQPREGASSRSRRLMAAPFRSF